MLILHPDPKGVILETFVKSSFEGCSPIAGGNSMAKNDNF